VLDAEDPLVADMARLSAGAVAFFARSPEHPVVAAHAASGGLVAYVRDGRIVLSERGQEEVVVEVSNLPVTRGGRAAFQVRNALAAAAAGRALGLSLDVVRAGLESFDADGRELPGRFEWIEAGGRALVLDACRNVDAVAAVVESLPAGAPADRVAVFEVPADAREADMEAVGAILATAFSRVFLCGATAPVEPAGGSARRGLCRGLASGGDGVEVVELADPRTAIDAALDRVSPGGIVLVRVGDRPIRDAARERVLGRASRATEATADGDSHRWK
jgi:cyanophycin synthetase